MDSPQRARERFGPGEVANALDKAAALPDQDVALAGIGVNIRH